MKRWPLRILVCLILGAITTVIQIAILVAIFDPFDWVPGGTGDSFFFMEPNQALWSVKVLKRPMGTGVQTQLYWPSVDHGELTVRRYEWGIAFSYRCDHGNFGVNGPSPLVDSGTVRNCGIPVWSRARRGPYLTDKMHYRNASDRSYERAWGWPLLSLRHERLRPDAEYFTNAPMVFERGAGWSFLEPSGFHPIWPGFLINTLFYAAIWFGVVFGFTGAKRFIRAKRGRCPRCGYDLRGQVGGEVRDQRSEVSGVRAGCPECGWNRDAEETERQRDGETK